jgi:DNA-binding beta-propeller fold protein YncE
MSPRSLSFIRAGCVLLALTLFVQLLSTVAAFTNGQAASLVLGQPNFTSNAFTTTASGMSLPYGVAVDPTSGKVFVADSGNQRVLRFASSAALVSGAAAEGVLGQPDFTSNAQATTASGMRNPAGVAVDSTGRLWVADQSNRRVLRFDGAAGKANGAAADGVLGQGDFTSSAFATTASGMFRPTGVAVDSASHLWVADYNNSRVLRFDGAAGKANGAAADGVLGQSDFTSSAFATTASGMYFPYSVAVDSAGRLWVADQINRRVLRFDGAAAKANGAAADGVLGQSDFISNAQATTASGMNHPYGVAVDSAGRLWVADSNHRVLRFDGAAAKANGAAADGVLGQSDFTSNAQATTASGMYFPTGVAVDSAGRLWVADTNNHRVLRFDSPIPRVYLPQIIR